MTRSITLSESDIKRLVLGRRDTPRHGILASLHAFMDRIVPWGYEDENGFHYGMEPWPRATPHDQGEMAHRNG